ncbi:MAG: membrane protein insertase YidC, partial [Candidatus Saccharibacteria bacterium]
MFTTFIIQPIFNLLVLVYALLPGHNFGLAIIIFTIIIRLLLWPLVKKQLHQTTAMRKLQPEIKKIKQSTKGNRAKESAMMMELYKEKGINPMGTFPILIVQFIVLIGLYSGLRKVIAHPDAFVTFAYPALQHLPWIEHLGRNIHSFDNTLFGLVDLSRPAIKAGSGLYVPALILVAGSAIAQYFQSKQL